MLQMTKYEKLQLEDSESVNSIRTFWLRYNNNCQPLAPLQGRQQGVHHKHKVSELSREVSSGCGFKSRQGHGCL
jgi:hypothetical protein